MSAACKSVSSKNAKGRRNNGLSRSRSLRALSGIDGTESHVIVREACIPVMNPWVSCSRICIPILPVLVQCKQDKHLGAKLFKATSDGEIMQDGCVLLRNGSGEVKGMFQPVNSGGFLWKKSCDHAKGAWNQ